MGGVLTRVMMMVVVMSVAVVVVVLLLMVMILVVIGRILKGSWLKLQQLILIEIAK